MKKATNNCVCPICGKPFHRKPRQIKKSKWGCCCSRECGGKLRADKTKGPGNHQYGLKGKLNASYKGDSIPKKNGRQIDELVENQEHPFVRSDGRVKLHRLIVEKNYQLFPETDFVVINGNHYLKPQLCVHHIDGNHNNNAVTNLMVVTRGEHTTIHNLINPMPHDQHNGRFRCRTGKR